MEVQGNHEREEQRSPNGLPDGSRVEQQLQQGSQGSRGSPEEFKDLRFDIAMLHENLRTVMGSIRQRTLQQQLPRTAALARIVDIFGQRTLVAASLRSDVDPAEHLSWMLLGFIVSRQKYEGEAVPWIELPDMMKHMRDDARNWLVSLKAFLGGRHGRALPFTLVCLGRIGIKFLELATKGQCAIGPLIGHHIMIHGRFQIDNKSTFGVVPEYDSIEGRNRPLYDGIRGLKAILTEFQAKSLGFREWLHSNY